MYIVYLLGVILNVTAAPYEYSEVVTKPYQCTACFGARYVKDVMDCVDNAYVHRNSCHVHGLFGVEVLEQDFLSSTNTALGAANGGTLASVSFPVVGMRHRGYWLDHTELEFRYVPPLCPATDVVVKIGNRHTDITEDITGYAQTRATSSGIRISYTGGIPAAAYMEVTWRDPKCAGIYNSRARSELIYGHKTRYSQ